MRKTHILRYILVFMAGAWAGIMSKNAYCEFRCGALDSRQLNLSHPVELHVPRDREGRKSLSSRSKDEKPIQKSNDRGSVRNRSSKDEEAKISVGNEVLRNGGVKQELKMQDETIDLNRGVSDKKGKEEERLEEGVAKQVEEAMKEKEAIQSTENEQVKEMKVVEKKKLGEKHPKISSRHVVNCGCPDSCDLSALMGSNKTFECRDRILELMANNMTEYDACDIASRMEGAPCGMECNPSACSKTGELRTLPTDSKFQRHERVVVATKVLWPESLVDLKKMFCLFTAAYNRHVNYDVLVFTTIPWTEEQVQELQAVVAPAKLTVALEGPPTLEGYLENMTKEELDFLYDRCGAQNGNISWFHYCKDGKFNNNLGYSWQAEFRSYHIWKHDALKPYKHMVWMDSDALCTKSWERDPVQLVVDNDLKLTFDSFPRGITRGPKIARKITNAYNRTICGLELTDDGYFSPVECKRDEGQTYGPIGLVHGFHHITDLDFYRSETNMNFLETLVGDYKFSRKWDDQLAVTIPAAMLAPEKSLEYYGHGIQMGIFHNHALDGKDERSDPIDQVRNFRLAWRQVIRPKWPVGWEMCRRYVY